MKVIDFRGHRAPLLAMAALTVLYIATLQPGVGWGDVAKYQYEAVGQGLRVTLVAGLHPWHHLASQLWQVLMPYGETALRQNLLSTVFALSALWSFISILRRLGCSSVVASLGALVLGISHVFWTMAVWAESYSLFAWLWILALGNVLLFLENEDRRHLNKALFWFGVGMGNNLLQPFAGPAVLATCLFTVPATRSVAFWLKPVGWGLLGLSPMILIALQAHVIGGLPWETIHAQVFDSKFQEYLFWKKTPVDILKGMVIFVPMALYQFGPSLLALRRVQRVNGRHRLFLTITVLTIFLFCSTYLRQRALFLLIAAWIPLAMLLTLSLQQNVRRRRLPRWLWAMPALTVTMYFTVSPLIRQFGLPVRIEPVGQRDPVDVFFTPWKHRETSAARFLDDVERITQPGDVIIADFTPGAPIAYAQRVQARLRDREVFSLQDNLQRVLEDRVPRQRVWLARRHAAFLERMEPGMWSLEPKGPLWRVTRARP